MPRDRVPEGTKEGRPTAALPGGPKRRPRVRKGQPVRPWLPLGRGRTAGPGQGKRVSRS